MTATTLTRQKQKRTVKSLFPILDWLPQYQVFFLRLDVIAALTVWALLVPEAMAYAGIAGKPPEDLTQQELEQAMDDLGIEEQEITPQDQAAIEAEAIDSTATQAQPAPAAPAAAQPPAAEPDYIEELRRLADLKEAGLIADEDFQAKKQQLLGL